jgi:two-component system, LytTR family, response regulator
MNCIIIDDEKHCLSTLTHLLETRFPEIHILATCNESLKAYGIIQQYMPDFIFLDIEMPFLNGFDLLSKFDTLSFDVIFTTAYDSYAIKAIKYSALDYLLKPIDKTDLAFAIEKVRSKLSSISKAQVQMAIDVHNHQLPDTIALPTHDGLTFASVNNIVYCSAEGKNTRLYMMDRNDIVIPRSLGLVEESLTDYTFFRIHHSILINLHQVKKYARGDGGEVIMSNGGILQVARARKIDFMNILSKL